MTEGWWEKGGSNFFFSSTFPDCFLMIKDYLLYLKYHCLQEKTYLLISSIVEFLSWLVSAPFAGQNSHVRSPDGFLLVLSILSFF